MSTLSCLLIDDDPDDREIFAIALEEADSSCKYLTAKNGVEALQLLSNDHEFLPDFIFLDLNMPLMSGKECLSEIRKIPHLNDIPVINYSTSSYEKDVEDTKHLGATHFVTKPPSIATLTNLLKGILKRQQLPFFMKNPI